MSTRTREFVKRVTFNHMGDALAYKDHIDEMIAYYGYYTVSDQKLRFDMSSSFYHDDSTNGWNSSRFIRVTPRHDGKTTVTFPKPRKCV